MLEHASVLAVVDLVLFGPALPLALWVWRRHGYGRHRGWHFLAIFTLLRVVGSSLQLASNGKPGTSLAAPAATLSSVGLSPLLLTMTGLLKTTLDRSISFTVGRRPFALIYLPIIVAAVLAAIGTPNLFNKDPGTFNLGVSLVKASIVTFTAAFAIIACFTVVTLLKTRHSKRDERYLLYALMVSLPFLAIRFLWTLMVAFDYQNSNFSPLHFNVIIQAFMATLEEFVTTALYLTAGVLTPAVEPAFEQPESDPSGEQEVGLQKGSKNHQTGVCTVDESSV